MSQIDFDSLRKAAANNQEDANELALVYNGRTAAMRSYNERPGKDTKADYDAAADLYHSVTRKLHSKYFPDQAQAPEGERLKNRKQAFDWITAQGYKVSREKFYNDCESGFPRIHRDKTISRFEALQYCQQLDIQHRGTNLTELAARREEAETRKAIAAADREEYKRDQEQRELSKNWITREDADLQTCAWAALTRDAIANRMTKNLPTIIHAAAGKMERITDVTAIIDQAITDACNDIANSGDVDIVIDPIEDSA